MLAKALEAVPRLRVYVGPRHGARPDARRRSPGRRSCAGASRRTALRVGAVKGYVDGVVEAKTAAMFEPYPGRRHRAPELDAGGARPRRGRLRQGRLAGDAPRDRRPGDRHGPHRVRAGRARERHDRPAPPGRARRGAAHGRPAALQGGAASSPPRRRCSPTRTRTTSASTCPTLGPERARRALAFKAIDDAGAVQSFGSDWPVFTAEVVRGIACAVTRTTVEGTPAGGLGALAAAHRRGGAAALHARRGLRGARREGEGHARSRASSPTSSSSRRTS